MREKFIYFCLIFNKNVPKLDTVFKTEAEFFKIIKPGMLHTFSIDSIELFMRIMKRHQDLYYLLEISSDAKLNCHSNLNITIKNNIKIIDVFYNDDEIKKLLLIL